MGLRKNLIYQLAYQIIILVVPLVLSKYVTNIINKDVLGVYSYSYSIASYFVIFAMLGIQKYGTRVISQAKNDSTKLRVTFWSLFTIHFILSFIALISYFILGLFISIPGDIYIIQGLYVASAIFDITWLFYGLENFKPVVIKNFAIKVLEAVSIILFIKGNKDLPLYTFIKSFSIFLSQVVVIPSAVKSIKIIKFSWKDMVKHIEPMIILSVSVLATSIYCVLDKVLLGALSPSGNGDVAIYEYADKIVKIPLSIIAAIETVMLPRLAYLGSVGEEKKFIDTISKSMLLISAVSIGAAFGLASIAKNFVFLWYGSDYQYSGIVVILLSPVVFAISFGDIIRSQFLIPKGKDSQYTFAVILGAVLNLIFNLIFIPIYGLEGAIGGTVLSEFTICILQIWIVRRELPIKKYLLQSVMFLVFGIPMLFINKFIEFYRGYGYGTFLLQVLVGGGIYLIASCIYIYKVDSEALKFIKKI